MTVLADRYELAELLGSGGMARVHAAVDRRLGRRVAVKLVREDLVGDERSRQRLLREARSAASFHHPNSVAVFDVGEDGRKPFIVMELVEGESLAERLERGGRLSAAETVRIGAGVLLALEAAHERGLVHRDIKPGNVLLPRSGGVKLADFGIAKAVADNAVGLTAAGDVMGTPSYLSPEQASGASAVPASDLYSLGIVLYECLTGEPPFTGENPLAVALAHQREPAPPVRKAARDVPAALADVVDRALRKDPAERYPDAAAMRRALEAAQGGAAAPTVAVADAPAYADTTVLPPDETERLDDAAYADTRVLPDGEGPGGAPDRPADEPRPGRAPRDARAGEARRRWIVPLLLALAALLLGGVLAVLLLGDDPVEDVEEPPEDAPAEDPADDPADEAPAPDEPPAETPIEETPADETPADETPAEEPADEGPPEEPPGGPPDEVPPEGAPGGNPPGQEDAARSGSSEGEPGRSV